MSKTRTVSTQPKVSTGFCGRPPGKRKVTSQYGAHVREAVKTCAGAWPDGATVRAKQDKRVFVNADAGAQAQPEARFAPAINARAELPGSRGKYELEEWPRRFPRVSNSATRPAEASMEILRKVGAPPVYHPQQILKAVKSPRRAGSAPKEGVVLLIELTAQASKLHRPKTQTQSNFIRGGQTKQTVVPAAKNRAGNLRLPKLIWPWLEEVRTGKFISLGVP